MSELGGIEGTGCTRHLKRWKTGMEDGCASLIGDTRLESLVLC